MSRTRLTLCTTVTLALLASATPPWGPDPEVDAHGIRERALRRERELGIERVRFADGSFELRPPAGLITSEVREENGVQWVYEGQQRHTDGLEPRVPQLVRLEREEDRSRAERLLGSLAVDVYGRRWTAAGLDPDRLGQAIAEYDALVEATYGLEPSGPELEQEEPEDEGWAVVHPRAWYHSNCNGDSVLEIDRWGSDDRKLSSNPMTIRQRKVVLILGNANGSGTMVDDEWVLTAAHVICDSAGSPHPVSGLSVHTYGNYQSGAQTFFVDEVRLPVGYTGDGDVNQDYAVLHLTKKPGVDWMPISQASNSTIKSADGYNVGYPSHGPGCSSTWASPVDDDYLGREQFWSKGDVFGTTIYRIKTRIDDCSGHSGGPFYYYPNGCCGSHYLTGVLSSFVNKKIGNDYVGGPKGSKIRDWVIAVTP